MKTSMRELSLLYVEDDDSIREITTDFFRRRFGNVWLARNGSEGLECYHKHLPDIVVTDIKMPHMNGIEMSRAIFAHDDKARIIVTSAYNESDYLLDAINLGISCYLLKPLERSKLDAALHRCVASINKLSSSHERDVASAYRSIISLLDQGEQSAGNQKCHSADIERQLDHMIESFMGGLDNRTGHFPEVIIMSMVDGTRPEPEWLWYERQQSGAVIKVAFSEPPRITLDPRSGNHSQHIYNNGELPPHDPAFASITEELTRLGLNVRNLVWYRNDDYLICGANYPATVTPFDAAVIKSLAVQALYLENISAHCHQTEEAYIYTITSLARAAEANDEDTGNHIVRVGEYCTALSRRLGMTPSQAKNLGLQSHLHDIGKIHTPPQLLRKTSRLTDEEMDIIKEHTLFGARIIGSHLRLETACKIALHHHERWDGSGYPYGLSGDNIPLAARIVSVADTYDALRSKRSYKPPYDHDTAVHIILNGDGRTCPQHFDPEVLAVFRNIHSQLHEIFEFFLKGVACQ